MNAFDDILEILSEPSTIRWNRAWCAIHSPEMATRLVKGASEGLDGAALFRQVEKAVAAWPIEIPRPAPAGARSSGHKYDFLKLCRSFHEEATYDLYIDAVAKATSLRLEDGTPSVSLFRQQRGTLELANGGRAKLNGQQPGLADLGGTCIFTLSDGSRIQTYVEAEVKLDGKIPPGAAEYRGTSRRAPDETEKAQIMRQAAQRSRGGFYVFVDRVADLVKYLEAYRSDVSRRLCCR